MRTFDTAQLTHSAIYSLMCIVVLLEAKHNWNQILDLETVMTAFFYLWLYFGVTSTLIDSDTIFLTTAGSELKCYREIGHYDSLV